MALEHVNVSEYITAMMKKQVYPFCFLLMCCIYLCMGVSPLRQHSIFIMQSIISISWYVPEIRQTLITICPFTDVIRDTHFCIIEYLSKTVSYTRTAGVKMYFCLFNSYMFRGKCVCRQQSDTFFGRNLGSTY